MMDNSNPQSESEMARAMRAAQLEGSLANPEETLENQSQPPQLQQQDQSTPTNQREVQRSLDKKRREESIIQQTKRDRVSFDRSSSSSRGTNALGGADLSSGKAQSINEVASQALSQVKHGDIFGAAKAAITAASEEVGQLATAKILQFMWENFYYVLPIFYIDFHFVMRYVAGLKVFCRLGQEWLQKNPGGKAGGLQKASGEHGGIESLSTDQLGDLGNKIADAPNVALEILEIIALTLCNGIIALAIYLIVLIFYVVLNPCGVAADLFGVSWITNILQAVGLLNICHL